MQKSASDRSRQRPERSEGTKADSAVPDDEIHGAEKLNQGRRPKNRATNLRKYAVEIRALNAEVVAENFDGNGQQNKAEELTDDKQSAFAKLSL